MSKLTSILLSIMIFSGFLETAHASAAPLGGQALKAQDQKQIELLEDKLEELKHSGGDGSVIQAYIDLAKEMMVLNDERHALHNATKSFAEAVGIFSKKIEAIIQKVNEILAAQSQVAINNAKVSQMLTQSGSTHSKDE